MQIDCVESEALLTDVPKTVQTNSIQALSASVNSLNLCELVLNENDINLDEIDYSQQFINNHFTKIKTTKQSGYYSIDDFNSTFCTKKSENDILLLQVNCRSIAKNFLSLKLFLAALVKKPDIISVSETWIRDNFFTVV